MKLMKAVFVSIDPPKQQQQQQQNKQTNKNKQKKKERKRTRCKRAKSNINIKNNKFIRKQRHHVNKKLKKKTENNDKQTAVKTTIRPHTSKHKQKDKAPTLFQITQRQLQQHVEANNVLGHTAKTNAAYRSQHCLRSRCNSYKNI